MPTVIYKKPVSDPKTKKVLERIANHFHKDVKVTSGDRNFVPKGGSKTSHHLAHRAADFHVVGVPDKKVFKELETHTKEIFGNSGHYQVISHGAHTQTQGAHIHIGRYDKGKGVAFFKEGYTTKSTGKYERVQVKTGGGAVKSAVGGARPGGGGGGAKPAKKSH